ncbi:MAG: MFS transporter [Clostridia bacterium]|nr:MFS transporter [Clostridia bacterium]
MNENKIEYYMNRNVKLHPLLNALTWDVIFVWTISTMFFTTQKGLSFSQTITLDSILMAFGCLFCVPVQKIFQRMKSTDVIRFAFLGYAGYLILCIFGTNFFSFILAQPFLAFGYAVNAVKINGILTNSLHYVGRDKDYQRICGKGLSYYYAIECVGAVLITYVYNWNAYVPYWISLGVVVFGFLYSFLFKSPDKFQQSNVSLDAQVSAKKVEKKPDGYFKMLTSGFFVCLLVFAMLFRGAVSIAGSSYKIYLNQIVDANAIPIWLFGYLFAISRLTTVFSSKYQFKFNLKFGVRSLIIIVSLVVICFLGTGLLYLYNPTSMISIIGIIILCCVLSALRMPNQIFINNYMQVCMPKRNMERAYAIRTMVEYLGYAAISALYAGLLSTFNDNWGLTNIVYIGILVVPLIASITFFIRALIKKHAEKFTVIKDEYTKDEIES